MSSPEKPSESWADETAAATNTGSQPAAVKAEAEKPDAIKAEAEKDMSKVANAQTDGASGALGGSSGIYEPSYEVNVLLSDLQADPDNPLNSVKTFEELGLSESILKGVYQMNFRKPSKIQEKALPLLIRNPPTNMVGQSQSGTGKTAAFVLNMFTRIQVSGPLADKPQAIVLAPTRELARQIEGVCAVMGQFIEGLRIDKAIPVEREMRKRQINAQIVVGTPGTTMDLLRRRQIDGNNVKCLVLDEADNMLDLQGLGDQCLRVKQHEELTVEGIKQLYLDCPSEPDKYDALIRLYGLMTIGSSIIFVRTRATAVEIERRMNLENHSVTCLTGEFQGSQRDVIIDQFRKGESKVLIATDVLARGIDIQTVSLVVNYDLPDEHGERGQADAQTYLHRIGRTGRFGRVGVAISLVHGRRDIAMIQEISRYFDVEMTALPHSDWDSVEEIIKKVIKSSRAGKDFRPGLGRIGDVDM
ncbi:RNA helicase required for poly(A+) mRNA export [Lecanora helva]